VRSRARGSGPGCPATCGESPRHPSPLVASLPSSFTLSVHVPRIFRESRPTPVGLARRRCALEDVEKVVTAPTTLVVDGALMAVVPGQPASGRPWRSSRLDNGRLRVPLDALHAALVMPRGPGDYATGMAALILLASGLPGHTQLHRNLRPADAFTDGRVDKRREFCLRVVSLETHDPDPLQQLGLGKMADAWRRTRQGHSCTLGELNVLRPPRRLRSRLTHLSRMRIDADTPVQRWTAIATSQCDLRHIRPGAGLTQGR